MDEGSIIKSPKVLRAIEFSNQDVFVCNGNLVIVSKVSQELHISLFEAYTFVGEALLLLTQSL